MLRKILLLLIILSGLHVSAQSTIMNKNIIYGEASTGGNDGYRTLTLNYERLFIQKGIVNIYGRGGLGIWRNVDINKYTDVEFFIGGGAFFGRKSHHLDVQLGVEGYRYHYMYGSALEPDLNVHKLDFKPYGTIGYRYQKPGQSFMFRVGTGTYGLGNVSVGFSF